MGEKKVLILSDIQSGSNMAPVHPKAKITKQDETVRLTRLGKELWKCWQYLVQQWKNPDYLILNAEGLEGPQRRQSGTVNWSNDIKDQVDNAKLLLEMFHAKKIYLTKGSNYHVSLENGALDAEEYLGDKIGAEEIRGRKAQDELWLDIDGCIFNFAHHISGTKVPQYRSTALTREMFVTYVNQKHLHNARVIIRSHVQYFWHVESESHHGFITPGMQIRTPYSITYLGNGGVASLGAIRPRVINGEFHWNEHTDKILFDTPVFRPILVKA